MNRLDADNHAIAVGIAVIPEKIRGFGDSVSYDNLVRSITKVEVTKPTVKDLRAILDRHPDNSAVSFTTEYDGPSYEEVVTVTIYTDIQRHQTVIN